MTQNLHEDLDEALVSAIRRDEDLPAIRSILLEYERRGVASAAVYARLVAILQDAQRDDTQTAFLEDKIHDVLDIVTGFCAPFLKVWDD